MFRKKTASETDQSSSKEIALESEDDKSSTRTKSKVNQYTVI